MSKKYWKIDDPLFKTLPKINRQRIQELFEQFKTDKSCRDELILSLLQICKLIIEQRLYKNPGLQRSVDDLVSILTLRTCTWVDGLDTPKQFTTRYYWQLIKNELNDFNSNDINPNVTGNWLRKQHSEGYIPPVRIALKEDLLQINPTRTVEFEDILLALAETDFEREVVILRFQGFNDIEIAEDYNISESTVSRTRFELEERYERYSQRTYRETL